MRIIDPPDELARLLVDLDAGSIGPVISRLMLGAGMQGDIPRLMLLLHWILIGARGEAPLTTDLTVELLTRFEVETDLPNEIEVADAVQDEVFLDGRRFRVFPGPHAGVGHVVRRLLVCAEEREIDPDHLRPAATLLALSEAIAARVAHQQASEAGSGEHGAPELDPLDEELTCFTAADLDALGISAPDLAPLRLENRNRLRGQVLTTSDLHRHPLIGWRDGVWVAAPWMLVNLVRRELLHILGPDAADTFYLPAIARWLTVDMRRLGAPPEHAQEMRVQGPDIARWFGQVDALLRLDADKQAHLLLLQASWQRREIPTSVQNALRQAIADHIEQIRGLVTGEDPSTPGLTLIVLDTPHENPGLGPFSHLGPQWFVAVVTAHSFTTLLGAPQFTPLNLWKMYQEVQTLRDQGVHVQVSIDPLIAWSIWAAFGFTFAPALADLRGALVVQDAGPVADFVANVAKIRGEHAVAWPEGGWRLVERMADADAPTIERDKPIYYQPLDFVREDPLCVVESAHGPWWVRVGRPPFSEEDREFLRLLFQATHEWLAMAALCAPEPLPGSDGPVLVTLVPIPEHITDGPDEARFFPAPDVREVRIATPANLMQRMIRADNSVEAETLTWVLQALLQARGAGEQRPVTTWIKAVLSDPDLKMIHVTYGPDQGFSVDLAAEKTAYRPLQRHDLAVAGRGLDRLLASDGVVLDPQPLSPIANTEQVVTILNAAVDKLWQICRDRLAQLDRRSAVSLALKLIEGVHRRRIHDERAARARKIVYAAGPDVPLSLASQRDAAFRTYRVVAEMAACAGAGEGGRPAGLSDLDFVAGQVAELTKLAEFSDGVQRGLIPGEIAFLPNGAIVPYGGGAEAFMAAYLKACLEDAQVLDEENYEALFEATKAPQAQQPEEGDELDSRLEAAFFAEAGVSLSTVVAVAVALQQIAVRERGEMVVRARSTLLAEIPIIAAELGVTLTASEVRDTLALLVLPWRADWSRAPVGFATSDIYPWFFERRLSLMVRPLVALDGSDDPDIAYGVRQVLVGAEYALLLFERGIWPKDKLVSARAKAFMDFEADRRGKAFEEETVAACQEAGWRVFSSLMMTRLGGTKKLGEIDVLAVSADGRTWLLCECKWFGAARTPREVSAWLQDFRGHDGDKLEKHLTRFEWVQGHKAEVARLLGLAVPDQILARVVTTRPVPLAFVEGLPAGADVRTIRQLRADLAS